MRYIRKYGVYTVIYGVYTVYGNPMYGSGQPYIYTVGSRSLRDHTFQKLIKISILVREVVWGLFFEFESSSGRPCQELNCEFERPPLLAAAAAAAAVQADGQTAHWLHGENHCLSSACMCEGIPQSKKQPSYPLVIFTNCVYAPREGAGGLVRGGGLFLEQHAWTPHGPLQPRPLPLPMPLPAP